MSLDQSSCHTSTSRGRRNPRRRPSLGRSPSFRCPSKQDFDNKRNSLEHVDCYNTLSTAAESDPSSACSISPAASAHSGSSYHYHHNKEEERTRFVATCSTAIEKRLAARGLAVPGKTIRVESIKPRLEFRQTPSRYVGSACNSGFLSSGIGATDVPQKRRTQRRNSIGSCSTADTITTNTTTTIDRMVPRARTRRPSMSLLGCQMADEPLCTVATVAGDQPSQRPRPIRRHSSRSLYDQDHQRPIGRASTDGTQVSTQEFLGSNNGYENPIDYGYGGAQPDISENKNNVKSDADDKNSAQLSSPPLSSCGLKRCRPRRHSTKVPRRPSLTK